MSKNEWPVDGGDNVQNIKDVRMVNSDERNVHKEPADIEQDKVNEEIQEQNKQAQRNAESDNKSGDASSPERSKLTEEERGHIV